MSYFFVKVKIPKEHLQPGDKPWMPTLIVFQTTFDLKGIAVFSSWLLAEEFSAKMSEIASFEREIVQLGDAGMPLSEFTEGVINATRSMKKAMVDTPIYVDPPDPFCKGLSVSYNNLQRFMRRAMRDELNAMCEHLTFDQYNGFTIVLHRRRNDGFFGCSAFRGVFTDAEAISSAIEDARGTTEEKYAISTEFYPLHETAPMMVKAAIDEIISQEPKKKIII